MAGNFINLNDGLIQLPELFIVDTNVIVEHISSVYGLQLHHANGQRADDFFRHMVESRSIGIVTPSAVVELLHIFVKFRYRQSLKAYRESTFQEFGPLSAWTELYKRDPSILRSMNEELDQLLKLVVANGIHFLDDASLTPEVFAPIPAEMLASRMCDYGLDSADTMILIEAERVAVLDIVTFDSDLIRASRDFNIYTWT